MSFEISVHKYNGNDSNLYTVSCALTSLWFKKSKANLSQLFVSPNFSCYFSKAPIAFYVFMTYESTYITQA